MHIKLAFPKTNKTYREPKHGYFLEQTELFSNSLVYVRFCLQQSACLKKCPITEGSIFAMIMPS